MRTLGLILATLVVTAGCGTAQPGSGWDRSLEASTPLLVTAWPSVVSPGTKVMIQAPGLSATADLEVLLGGRHLQIVERGVGTVTATGFKASRYSEPVRLELVVDGRVSRGPEMIGVSSGYQARRAASAPRHPTWLAVLADGAMVSADGPDLYRTRMGRTEWLARLPGVGEVRGLAADGNALFVLGAVEVGPHEKPAASIHAWTAAEAPRLIARVTGQYTGLAVDDAGRLYLGERDQGDLLRVDPSGPVVRIGQVETGPGADLTVAGTNLFVLSAYAGVLSRIPLAGGPAESLGLGFIEASGITTAADGRLLVGYTQQGFGAASMGVMRIHPETGAQDPLASFPAGRLDGIGDVVELDAVPVVSDAVGGTILALGEHPAVLSQRLDNAFALVAQGDDVYVGVNRWCDSAWPHDPVIRLDGDGGSRIVGSFVCPTALAHMPDGRIAVADHAQNARVLALAGDGSVSVLVPDAAVPFVLGLAVDGSQRAYVSSPFATEVSRFSALGAPLSPLQQPETALNGPLLVRGETLFALSPGQRQLVSFSTDGGELQDQVALPVSSMPSGVAPGAGDSVRVLDEGTGTIFNIQDGQLSTLTQLATDVRPAFGANEAGALTVIGTDDAAVRVAP